MKQSCFRNSDLFQTQHRMQDFQIRSERHSKGPLKNISVDLRYGISPCCYNFWSRQLHHFSLPHILPSCGSGMASHDRPQDTMSMCHPSMPGLFAFLEHRLWQLWLKPWSVVVIFCHRFRSCGWWTWMLHGVFWVVWKMELISKVFRSSMLLSLLDIIRKLSSL